jgi:hypothetical protein
LPWRAQIFRGITVLLVALIECEIANSEYHDLQLDAKYICFAFDHCFRRASDYNVDVTYIY